MTDTVVYPASPIKRRRATFDEMEERAKFLIGYGTSRPDPISGRRWQIDAGRIPTHASWTRSRPTICGHWSMLQFLEYGGAAWPT
jgi:hypothetical protein